MSRRIGMGLLLALATGCVAENSPWMQPGENCMECHSTLPGKRAHKKPWTVGGTIYTDAKGTTELEGAQILIRDARDQEITLTSNGAGNFYTGEDLQKPFKYVAVRYNGKVVEMPSAYLTSSNDSGACNYCHVPDSPSVQSIANARIYPPQ